MQSAAVQAIIAGNADQFPVDMINQPLPLPRSKISMPAIGVFVRLFHTIPSGSEFLKNLCAQGLDLAAEYTIVCPEDDCAYSVNALSHALGSDWVDPKLLHRPSAELVKTLLDNGADPNTQYLYRASDCVIPLKGSILMMALRKGNMEAAKLLLEHGARFDPETDHAPLSSACLSSSNMDRTIFFFLEYFNKGQITLKDVQAANTITGENALQIYVQRAPRADYLLALRVLVGDFKINPRDGVSQNSIELACNMAEISRRLLLFEDANRYAMVVSSLVGMAE